MAIYLDVQFSSITTYNVQNACVPDSNREQHNTQH